jgi:MFS transporter, ACS family, D-galactonate transporter
MNDLGTHNMDQSGSARQKKSAVRWRIFLLMLALVSINYVDRASISVAMPVISEEFSIGPAFQGVILSCFFWTYALMQIPGGWLADRFGPRAIIAAATVGWGRFKLLLRQLPTRFGCCSCAWDSVSPRAPSIRPGAS